jgi:CheY-like chemotaxis protein
MSRITDQLKTHILLADDDIEDCLLFSEALEEIRPYAQLTIVRNGEELMQLLNTKRELPDFLFLDLNMPRKNGFDCLAEIKMSERLRQLPVIIFSTSFEAQVVDLLYSRGAQHYICKPNDYDILTKVIQRAMTLPLHGNIAQPPKREFVLSPESCYNGSAATKDVQSWSE